MGLGKSFRVLAVSNVVVFTVGLAGDVARTFRVQRFLVGEKVLGFASRAVCGNGLKVDRTLRCRLLELISILKYKVQRERKVEGNTHPSSEIPSTDLVPQLPLFLVCHPRTPVLG